MPSSSRPRGWRARRATARPGPIITVVRSPDPLPVLPAAVEVAAYRIAVEALTNAVRHAAARTCQVRSTAADQLRIEVVDDGRGLPAGRTPGTGLESMQARATELGGTLAHPTVPAAAGPGWRLASRSPAPAGSRCSRPDRARDRGAEPVTDSHERIRLVIVDDHPSFRSGLRALLATADDLEVVGEARRWRGGRSWRAGSSPMSC